MTNKTVKIWHELTNMKYTISYNIDDKKLN